MGSCILGSARTPSREPYQQVMAVWRAPGHTPLTCRLGAVMLMAGVGLVVRRVSDVDEETKEETPGKVFKVSAGGKGGGGGAAGCLRGAWRLGRLGLEALATSVLGSPS
jgi:hypothetical protein